jgi:signal transduction protein with GAF and PtsI domain
MEGEELVLAATHGFDSAFVGKIRIKIGEGITGTVAKEKQHISLSRASQDPRYKIFPELHEEKYNSMLSFPIADKKDVYGVINLNSTSMKTFSDDEIYFVSIIANLILTAVKLRKKVASGKNVH